jgi:hypothetical protein
MSDAKLESGVEFTPEAQRTLEERTKAFGEELRLAAIEEAIRRRGSASEVNASDVLRAAAGALEQESLKAYEKKIDTLAKMLEEQSARSQTTAAEMSQFLNKRLEQLTGAVGMGKEREREVQNLYQKLQEQSFASSAELRNMLAHELHYMRSTLTESSTSKGEPPSSIERFGWLYLAAGLLLGIFGLIGGIAPIMLRVTDPTTRIFAYVGLTGIILAFTGCVSLIFYRIRRSTKYHFPRN